MRLVAVVTAGLRTGVGPLLYGLAGRQLRKSILQWGWDAGTDRLTDECNDIAVVGWPTGVLPQALAHRAGYSSGRDYCEG
jgi:hypothetical protein